jgi:hypothetical protein
MRIYLSAAYVTSEHGLTALADMYVDSIWECEDISGFADRALKARLNPDSHGAFQT